MFILILSLLIACLLPYIAKIPLALAMSKQPGGYDNKHPRTQQVALTGFGARAMAGHQNSFESLIIFSAACLCAIATKHIGYLMQALALAHLVCRIIYHLFYLLNWSSLRSLIWTLSYFLSLLMIALCLP